MDMQSVAAKSAEAVGFGLGAGTVTLTAPNLPSSVALILGMGLILVMALRAMTPAVRVYLDYRYKMAVLKTKASVKHSRSP
jgi:hypothetical protein